MSTYQSFNLVRDPSTTPVAGGVLDTDGVTAVSLEVVPGSYPNTGILKFMGSITQGFQITQGQEWCDGGTTIIPFTIWDMSGAIPVVDSVVWTDLTGAVVIPSGTQTPGACALAVPITPDYEGYVLAVPGSGSNTQIFTVPVNDISIYNGTDDVVSVLPTYVGAFTGNGLQFIPLGGTWQTRYENSTITDVTITNLAGVGGGEVIINASFS